MTKDLSFTLLLSHLDTINHFTKRDRETHQIEYMISWWIATSLTPEDFMKGSFYYDHRRNQKQNWRIS